MQGNIVVVGKPGDFDNGDEIGAVYVFEKQGESWIQTYKLEANDGGRGDFFGETVRINGDFIITGADNDDDSGSQSGAVYIFENQSGSWMQTHKLSAGDADRAQFFGGSLDTYNNYIAIGASGMLPFQEQAIFLKGEVMTGFKLLN